MSKSILSVNGNKAMNYLLQTILEKEYDFVPAFDVFQAVRQMKTNKDICALIVDLDYQPQQSWEFINHIKTSKLFGVPVMVLTSQNTPLIEQKCYESAVDEIFVKPFDPVEMIASVKNILTSKEAISA